MVNLVEEIVAVDLLIPCVQVDTMMLLPCCFLPSVGSGWSV